MTVEGRGNALASDESETARQLEALIHVSRDFIAIASIDGRIKFVNRSGRLLVGIPAAFDVSATVLNDYLTEDGIALNTEIIQPTVLRDEYWEGISTLKDWRSGNAIPVEVSSFLLRDANSREPLALATVQRDIRDRLEHEKQLAAARNAIRDSETSHRSMLEQISDLVIAIDRQGYLAYASAAATRHLGFKAGSKITNSIFHLIHPDDRAQVAASFKQVLATPGTTQPMRLRLSNITNSQIELEVIANNQLRDPILRSVVVVARDITERARAEMALSSYAGVLELIARSEQLEEILNAVAHSIEEQIISSFCSIFVTESTPSGTVLRHKIARRLPDGYHDAMDGQSVEMGKYPHCQAALSNEPVIIEDLRSDENWSDFGSLGKQWGMQSCWAFPIISSLTGETLGIVALYSAKPTSPTPIELEIIAQSTNLLGVAIDRTRYEERLTHLATHDELTGLANRTLLLDRLELAIGRSKRIPQAEAIVVFVDIDRLKVVNDSLGHDRGDILLTEIAKRLTAVVRSTDTVARFGGDEFVIVAEESDVKAVPALAQRLLDNISASVIIDNHEIYPTASAGVVIASAYESPSAVIRDADVAMYRAKQRGGARYEMFDQTMGQHAAERLQLEEEMRRGLFNGEFTIDYQPVIKLKGGTLVGYEALVRWRHPEKGLLSPSDFIKLAEETGLIVPLGSWVLAEAAREVASWRTDKSQEALALSVNLSAQQLSASQIGSSVSEAVSRLSPWQLCIELTEATLMKDPLGMLEKIGMMIQAGVSLWIDDFGTGYSSLSYLSKLPISMLKIDRSFVAALGHQSEAMTVAGAITSLAKRMDLQVVAEGVETVKQAAILRSLGCHFAQGYLFHRPLDVPAARRLLAKTHRPSSSI